MNCPTCGIEMKELEQLADTQYADIQEWPSIYWCPACGTFVDKRMEKRRIYIPKQIEDELFVWETRGDCWSGNCDCNQYHAKVFKRTELPKMHEGCVCVIGKVKPAY